MKTLDVQDLTRRVQQIYAQVATEPFSEFHFETGRTLAEKLGYPAAALDRIPAEAVDSFAGVGYHFDLVDLQPGESVVDLGSGSGMDTFIAALRVGLEGQVFGVDMTDAQLEKATRLRDQGGLRQVQYCKGFIEAPPLPDASVDAVISNGVINLSARKADVFREAARVLRKGGRFAVSDIVTEKELTEDITCNASLWAACIGGAAQQDRYRELVEQAGFEISVFRENTGYEFISKSARGASQQFGVKSISLVAVRR